MDTHLSLSYFCICPDYLQIEFCEFPLSDMQLICKERKNKTTREYITIMNEVAILSTNSFLTLSASNMLFGCP